MAGDGSLDDHGGGDDDGAPGITFAKSAPSAPAPDPIGSFDNQALHSLPALDGCLLELNLAFNLLSSLEGLAEACPDLERLSAAHNRLRSLPASLGTLGTLRRLDLSSNRLTDVSALGGLAALEELWLPSNRLALPALPALRSILSLRHLVLMNNPNLDNAVPKGLGSSTALLLLPGLSSLDAQPLTPTARMSARVLANTEGGRRTLIDALGAKMTLLILRAGTGASTGTGAGASTGTGAGASTGTGAGAGRSALAVPPRQRRLGAVAGTGGSPRGDGSSSVDGGDGGGVGSEGGGSSSVDGGGGGGEGIPLSASARYGAADERGGGVGLGGTALSTARPARRPTRLPVSGSAQHSAQHRASASAVPGGSAGAVPGGGDAGAEDSHPPLPNLGDDPAAQLQAAMVAAAANLADSERRLAAALAHKLPPPPAILHSHYASAAGFSRSGAAPSRARYGRRAGAGARDGAPALQPSDADPSLPNLEMDASPSTALMPSTARQAAVPPSSSAAAAAAEAAAAEAAAEAAELAASSGADGEPSPITPHQLLLQQRQLRRRRSAHQMESAAVRLAESERRLAAAMSHM